MKNYSCILLNVGTELSDGQILNQNGHWLAGHLTELGFNVVRHEVVADDRVAIRNALLRAEEARIVFVTGGLGPTEDDFTRDLISEWAGQNLEWDEKSWQKIIGRLQSAQIPVAESNRRQCYFPKSSVILINAEGTANAFYVHKDETILFALPGPPREIESIWRDHIVDILNDLSPQPGLQRKLFRFHCIGKSESALGEIVEKSLQGSGLQTGYRATFPYIEVKVWCVQQEYTQKQKYISQLENAVSPWLISKDGQDIAELFLQRLSNQRFLIKDTLTCGTLAFRLGQKLRAGKTPIASASIWTDFVIAPPEFSESEAMSSSYQFEVIGRDDTAWILGFKAPDQKRISETFNYPLTFKDRRPALVAELALFHWTRLLSASQR